MGKPKPAAAGGTPVPAAEQLAALEAQLAAAGPIDVTDPDALEARREIDEQMDELRNAARAEAEQERMSALAEQEIANHVEIHTPRADDEDKSEEPAAAPQAERSEGGE